MADKVNVRISGLDNAIFDGINKSRELRRAMDRFVDDVHDTWLNVWEASGPHPYETGDYIAHLKKGSLSRRQRLFIRHTLRKGVPIGLVYNDSEIAHFIEYGTDPDKPGGHSPWGPDTPTPKFEPMRRTAIIMNEGL